MIYFIRVLIMEHFNLWIIIANIVTRINRSVICVIIAIFFNRIFSFCYRLRGTTCIAGQDQKAKDSLHVPAASRIGKAISTE